MKLIERTPTIQIELVVLVYWSLLIVKLLRTSGEPPASRRTVKMAERMLEFVGSGWSRYGGPDDEGPFRKRK